MLHIDRPSDDFQQHKNDGRSEKIDSAGAVPARAATNGEEPGHQRAANQLRNRFDDGEGGEHAGVIDAVN